MANKAYKFRLYPNESQEEMISKTFDCVRFIYNKMLEDKIKHYELTGKMLSNTPAQYKDEFKWLRDVDSLALANAQMQLQAAYKKFFRNKHIGFPKFRRKHDKNHSYTTNNVNKNFRIDNGRIKLPKIGAVKVKQHRQIPSDHKIKSCTISRSPSGKYYISILTEYEFEPPVIALDTDKALGLDYSSPHFYVDSQGVEANMPHFYREAEKKLARERLRLSGMIIGSKNYEKQRIKIAKIHERIANKRKDWLHKRSRELADNWDIICMEDLNLNVLSKQLNLAKATTDNGFGMFREYLSYKMTERGKCICKIYALYPSSKTCHVCGYINDNLTLKDRVWVCKCGEKHLRDLNAAINIKNYGLAMLN